MKRRLTMDIDRPSITGRLVGVGASAGGLEALRELIASLPHSDTLSYVIAQHVSPTHVSMLVSLLAPLTHLKVQDLVDRQAPEPGAIYVTPPNSDVVLDKGLLRLTVPQQVIGPKPSVNHFFRSLADELGERAIGIILSGTGSDGAAGIRAIKAAGGIAIAQEPETAKYDGMPKAAIHTGSVDLIMPPAQMGTAIERLQSPPRDLSFVMDEDRDSDEYTQISNIVRINTAFKLSDYKSGTVRRRIARRMNLVGIGELRGYIEYLKQNREESQLLMRDTFISVTSFFRDQDAFLALTREIGELVRARKDRDVIRCWVPACASGEEVYSLAILFEEALRDQNKPGLHYMIFASDLDEEALDRARAALYPCNELDDVPKPLRDRYTEGAGDHCRVIKTIRSRIVFARQNVIDDPPFARLDLISCRNLLIYLNPQVQKRIFEIFHYSLNPGGTLFLGKSETADQRNDLFKPVNGRERIYRRQAGASGYVLPTTQGVAYSQAQRLESGRNATASSDAIAMRTLEELVQRYAPPSLVINSEDSVLHFQGDLKPFLRFPQGRANMCLFDLVDDTQRTELRALVYRCRRDLQTVRGSAWQKEIDGHSHAVSAVVSPLEPGQKSLLLVSFQTTSQEAGAQTAPRVEGEQGDSLIIQELEQELANTRTHLNVVVEELQTSNEELQSLNEELQSSNEELQSTNEELQTSNEELQSTNQELLIVNQEVQVKSAELEVIADDLINVKESLAFPLLVVNSELRITQTNEACAAVVALDSPLQGTSLGSARWQVDALDLSGNVQRVIQDGKPYRATVASESRTMYRLDVVPYRIARGEIAGAVLVFEDITAQHAAEAALKESNERFDLAVQGSSDGLWDWNMPTNQLYYSPRFKAILGYGDNEMDTTFDAWKSHLHPDDKAPTLAALKAHLKDDAPYDTEYRLRHKAGDYIWVRARGQVIRGENGEPLRMAGSITDVTPRKQAELAQRQSEEKLRQAMRYAPIGMAIVALDGRWLEVNPALCRLLGYTTEELLACDFQSISHPDDLDVNLENIRRMLTGEIDTYQMDKRYFHKNGHIIWAQLNRALVRDESGAPCYFIAQIQDITQRKLAEDELRLAASVFSNTLDGIVITDPDGTIIEANPAFEHITGYSAKEVVGRNTRILRSDRHDADFYSAMWQAIRDKGTWQGEIWDRHKDGHVIPVWLGISSLYDAAGQLIRYIAVMYDISELKLSQERINYLAHYDALTGLPNRALFTDRLNHALANARRQQHSLALLFIDLDNFKHVNDTRGHPVGDELLCLVAERLVKITREGDTVARLSGDEFTLLVEDAPNESSLQAIAQKVLALLAGPFELEGGQVFVSASIGIALYPQDGRDTDTLVKNADLAMYRSKEGGRNRYHFFTQEMSDHAQERMSLHNALRHALDDEVLEMHYQPIMDVGARRCVGAEALIRWNHAERGWIPPDKFIAVAEEYNLIHPLGEWVLQAACRQMKAWLDSGMALQSLAVNVSGKQIAKGDFVSMVQRIIEESGCPPHSIVLELTESFIMRESEGAIATLNQLRELGFGIAIDDFGTGYSSLSYLKRLPVTKLKLDQSFVRDIPDDLNDVAIARAILSLGNTLGLEVVAEGVETEQQHAFLVAERCALSQGYLYKRPIPPAAFADFVRSNAAD